MIKKRYYNRILDQRSISAREKTGITTVRPGIHDAMVGAIE